ncbi:MAG: hypothetical protein HRU17_19270 [Polyangiaceae bacterium]|nr:hypothetical protein [Polyangiaceae bacterium]
MARAFLRVVDFGDFLVDDFFVVDAERSRTADFGADFPRGFRLLGAEVDLGGHMSGF